MKKIWRFFLILFLTACVQAPKDVFTENLNLGDPFLIPVASVEIVNLNKTYDSKHYIENKWPQSPFQIIEKWTRENLRTTSSSQRLLVVIHQLHVVREDLPAQQWYKNDEVKDTLIYQLEFILKEGTTTQETFTVGGKAFVQMAEKLSLADKEKEWVQLINKMFENLNTQVRLKLK